MEDGTLTERPTILVVDDTPENLMLMSELLKDKYTVKIAKAGEKALAIAAAEPHPDLILLDIMMPGMDGYEVCQRLKGDVATRNIPVIFLTAKVELKDEERGLKLGAVDYITKPISPPIVLARVETHLKLKASADFLRDHAAFLEQEVAKQTREVSAIQDVSILALAALAETRDTDTGAHIRRTQYYVKVLAERLQSEPRFSAELDAARITMLFKSAPLHDIGKVGIPDHILLKPGRLEPHEMEVMKRHSILGYEALRRAELTLGTPVEFLSCAKEIARSHHEKWDGSGYPDGLSGTEIPLSARLMAVADVFDALISKRVYKEAIPHDEAIEIILDGKGNHFDPDLVDAFGESRDQFVSIASRYNDSESDFLMLQARMSSTQSPVSVQTQIGE